MDKTDSRTRDRILRAALRIFADCGYAGASVQAIVDAARVTKPTLYYYFKSKAGLFQALIDRAHDERFRLMQDAARHGIRLSERLVEIWSALFEFIHGHRELMRIAFATAFAAPREIPEEIHYLEKSLRNFEFMHDLIREGQAGGELEPTLDSRDLAKALWGMMTIRVMEYLVNPQGRLTRPEAENIVRLFMEGASARGGRTDAN